MPAKTDGERLDRLEQIVQVLAEDQASLQNIVTDLATETRRGFDQVNTQFGMVAKLLEEQVRQTNERFREVSEHMRETDERMRQTDERIDKLARESREQSRYFDERVDKLVIAIGELIRSQNGRDH